MYLACIFYMLKYFKILISLPVVIIVFEIESFEEGLAVQKKSSEMYVAGLTPGRV